MTGSLQIKKDTYYMVIDLYGPDGRRKPKWIGLYQPAAYAKYRKPIPEARRQRGPD